MEKEEDKIELYKVRDFGAKFSDAVDLIKANIGPLSKLFAIFILPVIVLQAFFCGSFVSTLVSLERLSNPMIYSGLGLYFLFVLINIVITFALPSIFYGVVNYYFSRPVGAPFVMSECKPFIFGALKRIVVGMFILGFIVGVGVLIIALFGGATFAAFASGGQDSIGGAIIMILFVLIAVLVFAVPLALYLPACGLGNKNVLEDAFHSYKLGFKQWGIVFGVCFVLGLIITLVVGISSLPSLFFGVVSMGLSGSSDFHEMSFLYTLASFVCYFLIIAVNQIVTVFSYSVLAVQYGSTVDALEGVSVADDLDNFDSL